MLIRKSSKKVANQNNVLTNEDTKILYENISSKSYVVNEKLRNGGSYLMKKIIMIIYKGLYISSLKKL